MPKETDAPSADSYNPAFSPEGLRQAVRHGSRRTIVAQAASHVTSIIVVAFLYHLVTPFDFGLIGMALPVVLFLRIFSSLGLNIATVQTRSLSPALVSDLFWMHVVLGVAIAALTAALAPAVAWFYGEPAAAKVMLSLAGTSIASAVGLQHIALLERTLRLGSAATSRLVGQAVGGVVAITMALTGYGVYALVAQLYVELVVLAAVAWYLEPWRPSRPRAGEPLGEALRFGGYFTAGQVVSHLLTSVDKVLVGATLGPVALGYYSQAFAIMMKPVVVLTTPLGSVMLPALARSAHDRATYAQIVLGFERLVGVASLPAAVGLALVARDTMLVLGGTNWEPAGPLLAVLALTIFVQCFVTTAASVFVSAGRWRAMLCGLIAMLPVLIAGLFAGYLIGRGRGDATFGVACGYALTTCVALFLPYMLFCLKLVGVSRVAWVRQLIRPALAAAAMGGVVWGARMMLDALPGISPLSRLSIEMIVGVAAYGLFAWREIRWCVDRLRVM